MPNVRFKYWQDGEIWLGHLEEYPDYMTQGETLEELKDNLRDLRDELTSRSIPEADGMTDDRGGG